MAAPVLLIIEPSVAVFGRLARRLRQRWWVLWTPSVVAAEELVETLHVPVTRVLARLEQESDFHQLRRVCSATTVLQVHEPSRAVGLAEVVLPLLCTDAELEAAIPVMAR